jgi:lysozyme
MMVPGVDVHSGYGLIHWGLVAQSGIRFAWVKCTQGNEFSKDTCFERNIQRARENGIAVGAYHFAYPLPHGIDKPRGRSPIEQAQAAFDGCSGLGGSPGELSPVVDAEWPSLAEWNKWGCTAKQISEWLHEYCEAATLLWGRKPVIYTYPDWWRGNARTYHGLSDADISWASAYQLWMASYTYPLPGVPDGGGPPVPFPWRDWAAWQYSADGSQARVPGISACPVDRDCIKDEDTFDRLTGREEDTRPEIRLDLLGTDPPPAA